MENWKCKHLFLPLIMVLILGKCSASNIKLLDDFDTSKVIVSFNPYVSILDLYDRSRYGNDELIQLVKKVATRFNKIHIKLETRDIKIQTSLWQTPIAVASFNCLASTKTKIEIFLEFDLHILETISLQKFRIFLNLSDTANTVCSGTVVSILLSIKSKSNVVNLESFNTHVKERTNRRFNYLFGFSMSEHDMCSFVTEFEHLNEYVLLLRKEQNEEYLPRFSNLSCKNTSNVTYNVKVPLKLMSSFIRSDMVADPVINLTRSVNRWRNILTISSDFFLISYAFDHYSSHEKYELKGWWYHLNDSGSSNTSEFVFIEKVSVAKNVDLEENPKNFKWLEQNHTFDKDTTGIVSQFGDSKIMDEFKYVCRIMYLLEDAKGLELPSKTELYPNTCSNFSFYHLPILRNKTRNSYTTMVWMSRRHYENVLNSNRFKLVPTNLSVYTQETKNLVSSTKFGYGYSIHVCGYYKPSMRNSNIFSRYINESSVEVLVFYYYEDAFLIEAGASRAATQQIGLFEKCRIMVRLERKTRVEISFVSLGYFMVINFYWSAIHLQNYVKYIYLLENWGKTQKNIVVFLGQSRDTEIILENHESPNQIVGWLSYDDRRKVYTTKREHALKVSEMHYPQPKYNITVQTVNITTRVVETVTSSGSNVLLVVSISLGVFVVFVATMVFAKCHYYKNDNVTNAEMGMFYNGDEQSNDGVQKIPYDRDKYEINEKDFKLESEVPLGAGEFGAVYRGTIECTNEKHQVAIKTSNPQKRHKTQLTGLLSEIKVLTHIGKHSNITELLGANTASINRGNVYIFLEFCHLGSLEKYLKEMRLLVSSPIQETNFDAVATGSSYYNASATTAFTLDDMLSEDLYRWSTEICNGMAFLAEKHVVHADLATRNILLNLRKEAKICDFGLSRRMYNYANYVKTQQEPLPWKWMAPESLTYMEFNEKSDVWAYGVTLWEIYSMGRNPYAGLSWDVNFSQMLEQGLRLSKPEYCEGDMYERMKKCWNIRPESRPTFSELLLMAQTLDDKHANSYITR